jgi:hypothetical protein
MVTSGITVARVRGGRIRIAFQLEGECDPAHLLAAHRFDGLDALDPGQRVLQGRRHLALYDLAGCVPIGRTHRHHRNVDVRVFLHRETLVGQDAEEHHHEAHDGREHRALDGEIREDHGR